uniref:beta'' subunit of RNA polymerase n=1 Tax=Coelastrella saipanensis TaxID=152631 RepID=UPI0010C2EDFC|nr:beta'' subunit of RNA polymerase [Coelastrella saipanensis]AVV61540.1 beta'' subunit of RNA polymerase [Coelastrella saipanensis]
MHKMKINKIFSLFLQKQLSKKTFSYGHNINSYSKKCLFLEKNFCFSSPQRQLLCLASKTKMSISEPFFFNFSFDKSRLKSIVSWFFAKYGQYKTIIFLERLKEFGFGYATTGGISLGIDDLKIPDKKVALMSTAETKVAKDLMDYRNGKITGIERTQRLIYVWNQTNDMLKQEVLKYFETMDLFNPIYMMAFSGARGNMSQVRQLVGMRGLMSDPQGQIIDFPIQSNFCEGLTLTEYLISTYGARKGIVDTALRTATAGYLTRRLVDVAQHVIVSQFDCGTFRGIFLFDIKEANKTIYSFQNRLIGRVLAQDIFISKNSKNAYSSRSSQKTLLAARNQEIDSKLAFAIAKVSKKALVRSPLTCETPRLICQLCYGWSLSQGKLVSVGEAVGVIAAQSIGEPGTQLTMRTFHTGGVFAGGLTDQILAPFDGRIQYVQNIPGTCIRTSLSEIAFLTKMPGSFFVVRGDHEKNLADLFLKSINYEKDFPNLQIKWKQKMQNVHVSEMYKIPAYAVLYLRNNEIVQKKQVLAQFSTVLRKSFQYGSAEQTFFSNLAGEFILNGLNLPFKKNSAKQLVDQRSSRKKIDLFVEKRSSEFLELSPIELKHDVFWKSKNWTNIWILSGKVMNYSFNTDFFVEKGDSIKKTSVLNRILWKKKKNWNISFLQVPYQFLQARSSAYRPLGTAKNNRSMNKLSEKRPGTNNLVTSCQKVDTLPFVSSSSFSNKMKVFNTKTFFIEQNLKKPNIEKFCSSVSSSTFSFARILFQKSRACKNEILLNKNVCWKNSLISCIHTQKKQIFSNKKFLPFSLFFFQFLSSSKQDKMKNKKFNKSKNDILFFKTFQKIFFLSSLRKQKNFYKKLSVNNIVYIPSKSNDKKIFKVKLLLKNRKNKNLRNFQLQSTLNVIHKKIHLKQIFFKFSTFHRTSPFFRFFSFSKSFNSSQFAKRESQKNFLLSKKRFLPFKFAFHKHYSGISFNTSTKIFATKQLFNEYKKVFNKKLLFSGSGRKHPANFWSEQLSQKSIFTNHSDFPFFRSFMLKNSKIFQNFKQNQNFKESIERQLLYKKTLFSFDYKKIRYKKYGYVFSFHNSLKNQSFPTQDNCFQIFTKLKQPSFDSKNITNPGKQETNISFGNGNFFGRDFPTFLTYYFPKNYQTVTNGIFTLLSFEKNSKKQKYKQFFCLKQKNKTLTSGGHFTKSRKNKKTVSLLQKTGRASMRTRKRKKSQPTFFSTKFKFLQNQTFYFINKKIYFRIINTFENSIKKNMLNYHFVKNSKQKKFDKTFSLFTNSLVKQKVFVTYGIKDSSSSKKIFSLKFLKKYNFRRFPRTELYTEEIFWIPQENYTFPLLDFYKFQQKSSFSYSKNINNELLRNCFKTKQLGSGHFPKSLTISSKTQKIVQNKKNEYTSRMVFKQNPLFYLSNSQGKKKPFFSVLEGIWNYSISLKNLKYKQFSLFQHRKKLISKKFHTIQQKFSLYKVKKQKTFRMNFSLKFFKNSSVKFLKLQTFKFLKTFGNGNFISSNFFFSSRTSFTLPYSHAPQKADKVINNNKLLFFSKKRTHFKIFPRFYFGKKFKQTMQKKFIFGLEKKLKASTFEKIKNLFVYEFEHSSCLLSSRQIQKKTFSKIFNRNLKKSVFVKKAISTYQPFVSKNRTTPNSLSTKNWKFVTTENFQNKIGKKLKNQCFTCIPFKTNDFVSKNNQKPDVCLSTNVVNNFHKIFRKKQEKSNKNNDFSTHSFSQKVNSPFVLQDEQLHLKIQSGWICIFPNSSSVLNKHQRIINIGHFFGKNFCFEQNKILQEAVIFEIPDCFSNVDFQKPKIFNTIPYSNGTKTLKEEGEKNMNTLNFHNSKKTKISFCLKLSKKNKKPRFSNEASIFASQLFTSLFIQKTPIEKEKPFLKLSILNNQKNDSFQINKDFDFDSSNINVQKLIILDKKLLANQRSTNKNTSIRTRATGESTHWQSEKSFSEKPLRKKIALFFRPMQYRLLENPKNYKKIFLKKTLENNFTKPDCISFVSSLKIYKKYHSIILNIQKPNKKFIQNIENIESIIKTDFQKIYKKKKPQKKKFSKQGIYIQSNKNKYNRNWSTRYSQKHQNVFKFDFSKNVTKIPHFQFYSKKTMFLKFQNLLTWNISTFTAEKPSRTKQSAALSALSGEQLTGAKQLDQRSTNFYKRQKLSMKTRFAMTAKTNYFEKLFFSFYPIQFLPLSISNSSLNVVSFEHKNSQLFSTIFLNSLNTKIDFSLCHKKAAFLNQRFYSFDFLQKFIQTSSFWLNNDGKNIFFTHSIKKNLFKNFWNISFSHSISSINKKNSLKKKRLLLQSNIHIKSSIFKNFIFQKNQNFYANTQFLSPFDGELTSMYTNELIWWKKASEISTIRKMNTLFSVITKKDLFSFDFTNSLKNKRKRKKLVRTFGTNVVLADDSKKSSFTEKNMLHSNLVFEKHKSSFEKENSAKFAEISVKYSLKTKQKHLTNLYKSIIKNQPTFESLTSLGKMPQVGAKKFSVKNTIQTKKFELPKNDNKTTYEISSFVTKYENKIYKFKKSIIGYPSLSKKLHLGKFLVAGDCILNFAIRKPGQIVHISSFKITLRRGQPFLVSPKGILHLANTPYIEKNVPILTLPYQTLQSGDIVQGIPKVEQFFEARTTIQGRLFISSLPILLKGIFQRYKSMLPLEQAVQQSFLKIQQLIVDGVQRVYRLQGVSIVDKHLEVIVRQMTTKVQIIHGAQTGFFPGELVNLDLVERINKFLMVKVRYEPIVLGITRASLEVDSFLSASSFQQTTKILALASISRKKDFLKGLKENILVGNLIPSGTGYLVLGKHL